jgi:hypothetical protein
MRNRTVSGLSRCLSGAARLLSDWPKVMVVVAMVASGIAVAAPAEAAPSCPSGFVLPSTSPDCYLLYMMAIQMHSKASPDALIAEAHAACAYMANSTAADPILDAAKALVANGAASSISRAGAFANYAAIAYCPSEIRQSG